MPLPKTADKGSGSVFLENQMKEERTQVPPTGSSTGRRLFKFLLLILTCALMLVVGVFLGVRFLVDGQSAAEFLIPRLESVLDKKISCSAAELNWISLDTCEISIEDLQVREESGNQVLFHVPRLVVAASLGPLIQGTLRVERAEFHRPVLVVGSGDDSGSSLVPPISALVGRLPVYPVVENLMVLDGTIMASSGRTARGEPTALFSALRIALTRGTLNGAEAFTLSAAIPGGEKPGSIEMAGNVTSTPLAGGTWQGHVQLGLINCPVRSFAEAARLRGTAFPLTAGTANLTCDLSGTETGFSTKGELYLSRTVVDYNPLFMRPVPVDKARVRFTVDRDKENLLASLSEVLLPGISVSLEARVKGLDTADPTLSLSLRKADMDLQRVSPFIPLNLLADEDRRRLAEAGVRGHLILTGGHWHGKTSDISRGLSLNGTLVLDALVDRVSGFLPGFGVPLTDATGQIRLSSDELLFKGISLTVGTSPIVLNGWITNLKSVPKTDLFISMKAQAKDLNPLLQNRIVAAHSEPWLGWMDDPQGGVSVTLDLKGDLRHPNMKGKVDLEDFHCRVRGIPLPLKSLNGSLRFRGTGVTFSDLKGMVGESPLEVKGHVSPEKMDVIADIKVSNGDLKKLGGLPSSFSISGGLPVSVNLKGKTPAIGFSATASLTANAVSIGHYIKKRPGVALEFEASGLKDSTGIVLDEAYLIIEKTRIPLKASAGEDGKGSISINLPPRGIPTGVLSPVLDPILELQSGGRLEGDAVVKIDNSHAVNVDADILINHVSLRFPGFHKRTEGMTGNIRVRGKTLHWTLERARMGNSLFSGSLTIMDFENPKVDVVLDYSFLDTTDYTAPAGYVATMTWGEWIRTNSVIRFLARSRGTGLLKASRGKTGERAFSDFKAAIEGNNGLLKVTGWQVNFADGLLSGTGLLDIRSNTKTPLSLEFQGDHLRMERLMTSDPQWLRVSGEMVVEGNLDWKLGPNIENRGIYKLGSIEVRMHDGVINRFDLLSKLFSLVNLGSLVRGRLPDVIGQGLPFHRLTWTMEVFDNKWKVKDMKLLSDAARIDSSGMFFSGQDRIDFRVDISPLVGFDAIFSGLFGNLFTRDGKILTTTFRIRGLYRSPDIRLEPFENFKLDQQP